MVNLINPLFEGDDSLVGTPTEEQVAYGAATTTAWAAGALLLGGTPVERATTDGLKIRAISRDGSDTNDADVPLSWFLLPPAAVGDTLTNATGISLTFPNGSVRIGRTANNHALIDDAGFNVDGAAVNFALIRIASSGGLLGRRLEVLRQHHTRTVSMKRRAASTPASPVIAYNGSAPSATDWVPVEDDLPAGTDPVWIANAQARYDYLTGQWTVGSATVVSATASPPQYGTLQTGPWGAIDPGEETLWVRNRLADGSFLIYQVRYAPVTAGWEEMLATQVKRGTHPHEVYSFGRTVDWSRRTLILFRYRQDLADDPSASPDTVFTGNWRHCLISPATLKAARRNSVSHPNGLIVLMSEFGTGYIEGDEGYATLPSGDIAEGTTAFVRLHFEAMWTNGVGRQEAVTLRVETSDRTSDAQFELWWI